MRGFFLGGAAGLLSVLLSNLTDSSFVPRTEHVYLWLAIGVMYGQFAKIAATAQSAAPRAAGDRRL